MTWGLTIAANQTNVCRLKDYKQSLDWLFSGIQEPVSWYLKGRWDQNKEITSLIEEFDIKVQMSLSISSAEMSYSLYLIPPWTPPLRPCDGPFRLFWSVGPVCSPKTGSIYY